MKDAVKRSMSPARGPMRLCPRYGNPTAAKYRIRSNGMPKVSNPSLSCTSHTRFHCFLSNYFTYDNKVQVASTAYHAYSTVTLCS